MKRYGWIVIAMFSACVEGCALHEITSKSKAGPEWQHKGSGAVDHIRWSMEQGFDFKWDKSITTGISYRRRDVDDGTGDNDNGVWLSLSFPLWKAPSKEEKMARQIEVLERRLAALEAGQNVD